MAWDKTLYPRNWDAIARKVKDDSGWRCACCEKICRKAGEPLEEFISRIGVEFQPEVMAHRQKWALTVAHCDHDPSNSSSDNLMPLCCPCHCRLDLLPESLTTKRALKAQRTEKQNQESKDMPLNRTQQARALEDAPLPEYDPQSSPVQKTVRLNVKASKLLPKLFALEIMANQAIHDAQFTQLSLFV